MTDKFVREAREFTRLFCLEYDIDPGIARSNLAERLKDHRTKVKNMTYYYIGNRIPGEPKYG